jgi:transposase
MIGIGGRVPVFAYAEIVDMRKSFDTLAAIVREQVRPDVLDGALTSSSAVIAEERR